MDIKYSRLIGILALALTIVSLVSCGNQNTQEKYKSFSKGKQEIIKLQLKKGTEAVLALKCESYDSDGKDYCNQQKKFVLDWKNEISWENTLKKGDSYIKTFDCNKIKSSYGQKYCLDYKKNQKINTATGTISKEFDTFLKLPKSEVLSYDCNKFSSDSGTGKINMRSVCKTKKISINLSDMTKDELLKFDCNKKYADLTEKYSCEASKVTRIIALQTSDSNKSSFNCKIFTGNEYNICEIIKKHANSATGTIIQNSVKHN